MTREPPQTEEGWYALHDLRRIDWDAWREASARDQERALVDGIDFLEYYEGVEDAEEGQTAVYTVQGHKADLMVVHLRPTMADIDAAERQFEQTEFARYTDRATSYVSVTEASGYTDKAKEYFDGEVDDDSGLAKYIRSRLHPDIPDDEFVCFYPMSKRRDPEQNWYDMPFDERAEHIERHGDIGRGYGGKVSQMIAGSIGFDDWEWGITLWADDMTDVKDLLTEMRFDPSTSKFAEFGSFYVGRRFRPGDLPAVMAGERVPTGEGEAAATGGERVAHASAGTSSPTGDGDRPTAATARTAGDAGDTGGAHPGSAGEGDHPHAGDAASDDGGSAAESAGDDGSTDSGSASGGPPMGGDGEFAEVDDLGQRLGSLGVREAEDYDAGDYGLLFHSEADAEDLAEEVEGLRSNFDHYDRHVLTSVRAQGGQAAVVSVWTAKEAAETAAGFLGDLPGIGEQYGGHLGEGGGAADADATDESAAGDAGGDADEEESIREELSDLDIYAGKPHGEDVYALVLYSETDPVELAAEVGGLREHFVRYDSHVKTAVYRDAPAETVAVVSLWKTRDAADTASEHLADLPGVVGRPEHEDGFGTMGMFYTVKPEHREEFVETFGEVGGLLAEMDGHRETTLLANREDENDMFIASQWDAREDAMEFFRSDAFAETVEWGRDVLADRPRHVFLA
ncbi:chlorite dismutase [Halomicrobium zhouii]|uniref:Chlorite dismutase n=1 Tax=Halomicrobium zhouii TaxID=767519 RepID=A0A1I6KE46_9EURY|nr:heme-binding protein [Halomicrobium zhouii]SFR89509.1 chlorite dismutase [Halomicrobium zhouii]